MSLAPGAKVGPYTISHEIGRGGMGVVFLARDDRLDRNVAIKALPDHLAHNTERLERLRAEARALAQVNHPNVAGIHGLEEEGGQRFLVLEFVEGESLADRLAAGPLPIEDALEICTKIAAGVEAAHEAGVIHRDLEPDNVRITPDGDVRVLDFGLAKLTGGSSTPSDPSLSRGVTVSAPRQSPTIPGQVMGTPAYMSPEQARGRGVDKRTDIWSLAVVLYECLSGSGPFVAESAGDSIAAILHKDVDFDRLPVETPAMVRHVLEGCLARDKSERYRDIGDVRIELARALSPNHYGSKRGSPDGRSILLSLSYPPKSAVLLHDLDRGLTRRHVSGGDNFVAVWGPGRGQITFDRLSATGRTYYFKPIDGRADHETEIPSPEGKDIWFTEVDGRLDVGEPEPLFKDTYHVHTARTWDVLQDGRFLLSPDPTPEQHNEMREATHPDRIQLVQSWVPSLE